LHVGLLLLSIHPSAGRVRFPRKLVDETQHAHGANGHEDKFENVPRRRTVCGTHGKIPEVLKNREKGILATRRGQQGESLGSIRVFDLVGPTGARRLLLRQRAQAIRHIFKGALSHALFGCQLRFTLCARPLQEHPTRNPNRGDPRDHKPFHRHVSASSDRPIIF
jgi:hypothetical protein